MEVDFDKSTYDAGDEVPIKYEYLDHTADVQLHAWGKNLQEAFEQCGLAMFGYMTDLPTVTVERCFRIEAQGDDLQNLLYQFLDELLFLFSAEPFLICKRLVINKWNLAPDDHTLECLCYGEPFDLQKHPQGTEVKAITYSAMQINEKPDNAEVFVIIDI